MSCYPSAPQTEQGWGGWTLTILCDSSSIQKLLDTQSELTRLIAGYVERISDYEGYKLGQLAPFVVPLDAAGDY